MSESMYGYLFLILGIFAAAILLLFGSLSVKDEQNYYLLKEVTEAAMLDSVDKIAYEVGLTQEEVDNNESVLCVSGKPGTIRIIKEQFVENFTRRFAEVVGINADYTIKFYDIDECPPKVSVRIISNQNYSWLRRVMTGEFNLDEDNKEIINDLNAILESKN